MEGNGTGVDSKQVSTDRWKHEFLAAVEREAEADLYHLATGDMEVVAFLLQKAVYPDYITWYGDCPLFHYPESVSSQIGSYLSGEDVTAIELTAALRTVSRMVERQRRTHNQNLTGIIEDCLTNSTELFKEDIPEPDTDESGILAPCNASERAIF